MPTLPYLRTMPFVDLSRLFPYHGTGDPSLQTEQAGQARLRQQDRFGYVASEIQLVDQSICLLFSRIH